MSYLSRSNVAHDLNISPHVFELDYDGGNQIKYVFSSDLYKRKFIERMEENRNTIDASLSNRFGFKTMFHLLSDLKLYVTIEKRGFLIYVDGVKIECRENITLDGLTLITEK